LHFKQRNATEGKSVQNFRDTLAYKCCILLVPIAPSVIRLITT